MLTFTIASAYSQKNSITDAALGLIWWFGLRIRANGCLFHRQPSHGITLYTNHLVCFCRRSWSIPFRANCSLCVESGVIYFLCTGCFVFIWEAVSGCEWSPSSLNWRYFRAMLHWKRKIRNAAFCIVILSLASWGLSAFLYMVYAVPTSFYLSLASPTQYPADIALVSSGLCI